MSKKRKIFITILLIIGILASLMFVVGGVYYYQEQKANQEKQNLEKDKEDLEKEIDKLKKEIEYLQTLKEKIGEGGPECVSELTDADRLEIELWETYEDSNYGYSFKYPQTWTITKDEDSWVILEDDEANIIFQIRSGEGSGFDFVGYVEESNETIQVACEEASCTYYTGDTTEFPDMADQRSISTIFTKNEIPHNIKISYTYLGASISGDITEAFDLILKTIEFN